MNNVKHIASNIHDYTLSFEATLSFLSGILSETDAVFIVDSEVFELYPEFSVLVDDPRLILLHAIEENKTLAAAEKLFDRLIELKPTKKTKIISIGGGITQDVSGFVASTFFRGLHWVYVPTTLLAQADSCMGSKTSLNYKSYKNILGTFYPPHSIFIATSFTNTLKEEDLYSGMGEIAKLHVMGGKEKLRLLQAKLPGVHSKDEATILELTRSSLDIKWTYMADDEFDQGKRNMLNYGHCFGHAIETAVHYSIPHGQAVVIGMILANKLASDKGAISVELNNELNELFFAILKSDYHQLKSIDNNEVINAMKQDKKRSGNGLPLIMLNNRFEFYKITDMTEDEATNALDFFKNTFCK